MRLSRTRLVLLVTGLISVILIACHQLVYQKCALNPSKNDIQLDCSQAVFMSALKPAPANSTSDEEQMIALHLLYRMMTVDRVQYNCKEKERIKYRFICNESAFAVKPPCLVYSFGINYDFSFDDFFGRKGCDVYSFDPSMSKPDHRRNAQVMFYHTGIGETDTDTFQPRLNRFVKKKTTWKMRTLKTLVSMLNHTERTIDVLKIDIECTEWSVTQNLFDTGMLRYVKQFIVEWHIFSDCPPRERFQQMAKMLLDLEQAGFQSFFKQAGVPKPTSEWTKPIRALSEMGYVNIRFNPSI